MLPVLAATARRQGSQLAAKNSALSWLTPVNPPVPETLTSAPARFRTPPVTYVVAVTVPAHLARGPAVTATYLKAQGRPAARHG
jgi:hypothetical protein